MYKCARAWSAQKERNVFKHLGLAMSAHYWKGVTLALLSMGVLLGFSNVVDAKVVVCNSCVSYVGAARGAGEGIHLVADFNQVRLAAYEVYYDAESQRMVAFSMPVPSQIQSSFLQTMSTIGEQSSTSSQILLKEDGISVVQAANGTQVVIVTPSHPQFPTAYRNWTSHTYLTSSATAQLNFDRAFAAGMAGATTSSSGWNAMAFTLRSLALNFISSLTDIGAIKYEIRWNDGSITNVVVTAATVTEADYVIAQSRDRVGNRLPDRSLQTGGGYLYQGPHFFASPNDSSAWTTLALQMGAVVTNAQNSGPIDCTWDGRTLKCNVRPH